MKVISRHSALAFKGSRAPLAEIARTLGVANVIVGSVRRERDTVRIHLELRRAGDEALLWSLPKGDRTLSEVLALQSEIAEQVARVLQARDAQGNLGVARFMTKNPQAYDLFLKLNVVFWARFGDRDTLLETIRLAREVFDLDPTYMSAAQFISISYGMLHQQERDPAKLATYRAESLRWAETASRLMPGGAGDTGLVQHYAQVAGDFPRAIALAENAGRALPNDGALWNFYASALGKFGRHRDAEAALRRAIAVDPGFPVLWSNILIHLAYLWRSDEWLAAVARLESIGPLESRRVWGSVVQFRFMLFGELPSDFTGMSATQQADWRWRARQTEALLAFVEQQLSGDGPPPVARFTLQLRRSDALRRKGDTAGATEAAKAALALAEDLKRAPNATEAASARTLAEALVRLGRADEAVAAARRVVELTPEATEPVGHTRAEVQWAVVCAQAGRTRECLELLAKLLRIPSGLTVPMLRVDPTWDRVREDPGFKALLTDPKNSAPF